LLGRQTLFFTEPAGLDMSFSFRFLYISHGYHGPDLSTQVEAIGVSGRGTEVAYREQTYKLPTFLIVHIYSLRPTKKKIQSRFLKNQMI